MEQKSEAWYLGHSFRDVRARRVGRHMPVWKPHALQVVWFVDGQHRLTPEDFFQRTIGMTPQSSQMNQSPQPSGGAVWNLGSNDSQYAYQLQIQLGRIDLIVTAHIPPGPPPPNLPLMQNVNEAIDHVVGLGKRGADFTGNITRIAVIGEFHQPASSLDDANSIIGAIIGRDNIPPGSSDINFQINNRKSTAVLPNILMNRLLQWTVATIQTVVFTTPQHGGAMLIPGFGSPMSMQGAQIKESFAASLKIDVNTHATSPIIFSTRQQVDVFSELADEQKRIIEANTPRALA